MENYDELNNNTEVTEEKLSKKELKKQAKAIKEHYKYLGHEEDEDTNIKIRVYNEMVRHAYEMSENKIECLGITSQEELDRIFNYVLGDYPDIFWVNGYIAYTNSNNFIVEVQLTYRCLKPNGEIDKAQILQKQKELKKAAKPFLEGISKKDSAYDAFLKIYRRLILTLDYDGRGLKTGIDADESQDDRLRSLHSALVNHKVVCAGYASALQYLLHLVGIVCGYVSSEKANNSGHAFNIVKIGKYCYYCDPTWGDSSNTLDFGENKEFNKNIIRYDYCLVPYQEFQYVEPGDELFHTPNETLYPDLGILKATNHEYYRYHKYFITNYNEEEMVDIFERSVLEYDPETCGIFTVSYRAINQKIGQYALDEMVKNNGETIQRVIRKVKERLKDKKKALLFDKQLAYAYNKTTHIGTFYFI